MAGGRQGKRRGREGEERGRGREGEGGFSWLV